jgi:hypothetical protein
VRHVVSRLLGQFETFGAKFGDSESRGFGRTESSQLSQILIYTYETSKARQLVLTGLVWFETSCTTRLSGGGYQDSQRLSPAEMWGRLAFNLRSVEYVPASAPEAAKSR